MNTWKTGLAAGLLLAFTAAQAEPTPKTEQLQLSQCLANKIQQPYKTLAENKNFKIIDIASKDVDTLAKIAFQSDCGRFVNVSHRLNDAHTPLASQAKALLNRPVKQVRKSVAEDYPIRHQEAVKAAIAKVSEDNIWQTLSHLTSYYNRSAFSDTGVETAGWLKERFDAMAVAAGRTDVDSYFVETGFYYPQPSLVTVIGKNLKKPAIVIGAHMDTLDGRMPGAGDDGSGSSSVMEAARVLFEQNIQLERPLYIIWYSAEERGLVGSQYVVDDFIRNNIPVKAAIQFDMTGYRNDANDPTMWVFNDYTDKNLNNFVSELIKTYIQVPVKYSKCGYGCSDHASWMEEGIPASFPCETSFPDHNPYIHTSSDTMQLLSGEHMANFSRLAVAFAIELATA